MAFDNIGYSRDIPIAQNGSGGQSGPAGVSGISPQQAVKIFSLRVPEQPSQGSVAPLQLLNSPGGGGASSPAILQSALSAASGVNAGNAGQNAVSGPLGLQQVLAALVGMTVNARNPYVLFPTFPGAAPASASMPSVSFPTNPPPPRVIPEVNAPPLPQPTPAPPTGDAMSPHIAPGPVKTLQQVPPSLTPGPTFPQQPAPSAGAGPTLNPRFNDSGFLQSLF